MSVKNVIQEEARNHSPAEVFILKLVILCNFKKNCNLEHRNLAYWHLPLSTSKQFKNWPKFD